MKKLIIIPTYNEKENIHGIVPEIFKYVPDTHILIVDDSSPDQTALEVKNLQKQFTNLHLLERKEKNGLGKAYLAGFKWALENNYDFIVEMDADWSHPPRFLNAMFENSSRADYVIGSRYVKGGACVNWTFIRKMISVFGSLYSRIILGVAIRDFTGGFNGWHSKVLRTIPLDKITSDGYSFQIEMKYRAYQKDFKFTEFPITFEERREGQSKMSADIVREAVFKVWSLRNSTL